VTNTSEYGIDLEIRDEFIDEALEGLNSISSLFVEMEAGVASRETVDRIFRVAHTIKGNSAYFDLMKIKSLAHEIENVLAEVRKETLIPTPAIVSALLAGADELAAMLNRVRGQGPELIDQALFESLLSRLTSARSRSAADQITLWEELIETLQPSGLEGEETSALRLETARALVLRIGQTTTAGKKATGGVGPAPGSRFDGDKSADSLAAVVPHRATEGTASRPEKAPDKDVAAAVKTMRITETSIDAFLAFVGDLVVLREMYDHLQVKLSEGHGSREAIELRRINESFTELSLDLQKSIMDIRKVPLGNLLKRAPRIIRDVATAEGKLVETVLEGTEIMVDKSLAETLEAPLIHMVRNAVDHGIESPAARAAAGKDSTGRIWITAAETPDFLTLEVRDDGKGLNREALTRKGVELGLVPAGTQLCEADILKLLFAAGVSTAEKVSDISGRGVGMDVVRQNIENNGGRIKVTSVPGQGSTFSIAIKKSVNTQIIDGFTIIDQGNPYVVPMERVVRCFRPGEGSIQRALGKGTFVRDGDELIAVYNFGRLCGLEPAAVRDPTESILLVLEGVGNRIALQVDSIDSVKQVVLKEVDGLHSSRGLFVGGAVMGNGQVAMIVDVDALVGEALGSESPDRASQPHADCAIPL